MKYKESLLRMAWTPRNVLSTYRADLFKRKFLDSFAFHPPNHCSTITSHPLAHKGQHNGSFLPPLAIPGQCLGSVDNYGAGPGTHIQQSNIYASIAGPVVLDPAQPKAQTKGIIRITRTLLPSKQTAPIAGGAHAASAKSKPRYNTLPAVESIVLARVTRVQKRQATVSILVVLDDTNTPSADPSKTASDNDNVAAILSSAANPENHSSTDELRFQAQIRKEDVRAVEKDRVIMDEMFRVGDIVRGSVISLGDQSFYYLTTARNDLGVVMARSEAGNMMFPVSWNQMRDPYTGVAEQRKVARPN
ncbi:hypothetical protein N7532_005689 [Penicillium argentinense]|uniref:Exosome complex subunit Csl4 n=1 Tax=Penicillium argentinense TaxID=1131581 RepID=A0A9W9FEB9_9EURO|nr:uncharacterized protein N7532_005689 [Penicillium argentinense]KAJ5098688.1 hypothetical protein N7532_005689 [Penicillium argentinense]